MCCREVDLSGLFEAVREYDDRLFGVLGTCKMFGGAVEIDIGIGSSDLQEAVIEHELTHRDDLFTTHFGNLYNLVGNALRTIESLDPSQQEQIQELAARFSKGRFLVALEGRATFNERTCLSRVAEDVWRRELRNRRDQAYHDGYGLASRIMAVFGIEERIVPHLSDVVLTLPLCVEWYDHFRTISSGWKYVRSLGDEAWPDRRMSKLASCLEDLQQRDHAIIAQFCREVNAHFNDVYVNAQGKVVPEITRLPHGVIVWPAAPTGTDVSHFLRELMAEFLREPLRKLGFAYADQGDVPEINRIVRSWNREIAAGKPTIPEFQTATGLSLQYLHMQFVPLGRKRTLYPIGPEQIIDVVQGVLRRNGGAYFVARLHQVWEPGGWEMAEGVVLPFGAWYFVLGARHSDLCGDAASYVTPTDSERITHFLQLYCCLSSADALLDELPLDLPRTLWLLPSPDAYRYTLQPSLRDGLMRVTRRLATNAGWESDCYSVLVENSIDDILRDIAQSPPARCLYNDCSSLWRVWRTEGSPKRLFFTSKAQSMHRLLGDLLESHGIRCESGVSPHDAYLAEWLLSGEGF